MKVAYIAGPYRAKTPHGIVENIRKAEQYAIKYWSMGYAVICPHKNTALLDGVCPDEVWLEGAMELLRRADVVVFIPGYKDSTGSMAEFDEAVVMGKEIIIEDSV